MNWGHKITLVLVAFVLLIMSMVTICMKQKDIFLVSDKYYEKEIAYQQQIDIEKNTAALKEKPVMDYRKEDQKVTFTYPEDFKHADVSGNIVFFRPADATKDFTIPLKNDSINGQAVSVAHLDKGLWRVKMEWTSAEKTYYLEEKLVVL